MSRPTYTKEFGKNVPDSPTYKIQFYKRPIGADESKIVEALSAGQPIEKIGGPQKQDSDGNPVPQKDTLQEIELDFKALQNLRQIVVECFVVSIDGSTDNFFERIENMDMLVSKAVYDEAMGIYQKLMIKKTESKKSK